MFRNRPPVNSRLPVLTLCVMGFWDSETTTSISFISLYSAQYWALDRLTTAWLQDGGHLSKFHTLMKCIQDSVGNLNMPPQNMPPWRKDRFELEANGNQQIQTEAFLELPLSD